MFQLLFRLALLAAGAGGTFLGLKKFTEKSEYNYFNKGVCKKCGGHFKMIPGTEVKGAKGYKCDVCDNCVWITFGTDEGYIYTPSKNKRQ
jgi:hypothetical protein